MALTGVNAVPATGVIQSIITSEGHFPAYGAAKQALALHATPNIVLSLFGSASTTVRPIRLRLSGAAATAEQNIPFIVSRYSGGISGGTSTGSPAAVPNSATDPAAYATVLTYTADPTATTLVGAFRAGIIPCGLVTVAGAAPYIDVSFVNPFGKGIILKGVNDGIVVNLGGVTLANATTLNIEIEWAEDI